MAWTKMRVGGQGTSLPGDRGRYLLWLERPHVEGQARYVHFSWKGESFCIRDYMGQLEQRQSPGLTAVQIWEAASDRIPCKGELYVPVENYEFWTQKLTELSTKRGTGPSSSLWSRISSKFSPKHGHGGSPSETESPANVEDIYGRFCASWRKGAGFDVLERTVGCSARYRGNPVLWVYPTYLQVAPKGKGNVHYGKVLDLRNRFFPELIGKGTIGFTSEYFSEDRFQAFINEVKRLMQRGDL